MSRFHCTMFLLACVLAHSALVSEARIASKQPSPKLSPVSHKKFFGKDYPTDTSPTAEGLAFDHPYPAVQDSDDFDKDYVKDENNADRGLWKAQMLYDKIRAKFYSEKHSIDHLLVREETAKKELDELIKQKKEAEAALSDAERKALEAQKSKDAAENAMKDAGDEGGASGAEDDLDVSVTSLADCKEQLAKARAALADLVQQLKDAKQKEKDLNDLMVKLLAEQKRAREAEVAAQAKVTEEAQGYADSKEKYEKSEENVEDMEKKLEIARKKVQAYRDAADADGGVYPVKEKSSAPALTSPLTGLALAAMTVLMSVTQGA